MKSPRPVSVLLALAALLLLGAGAAPGASRSLPYHWPIKPFDRQHPIRGAFGDPRTIAIDQPFGVTRPGDSGGYSFHNGIDIAAPPGTPVYPVAGGQVVKANFGEIVIHTDDRRVFQYVHLAGDVRLGQHVVAYRTVLGWIKRPFDHVHFAEIDHYRVQNPLAPGHLEPYADHTTPEAVALDFSDGQSVQLNAGGALSSGETLAIDAVDTPAMPVAGPFAGLPQAPAVVEWRLQRTGEKWGSWHIASDFRNTQPARRHFWDVYAAGTYQNCPVFDRRLYKGSRGLYLFRVDLDTSSLPPGRYALETRVADIRGNESTATWPLDIAGS